MARVKGIAAVIAGSIFAAAGCLTFAQTPMAAPTLPLGLPPLPVSSTSSAELVALGATLFQDKRLSHDGKVSCASCHDPAKAFSDGGTTSTGAGGATGTRNSPSLLNVAYHKLLFWDGRRSTLEAQAADPFFNPRELGLTDPAELIARLADDAHYQAAFRRAFDITQKAPALAQVMEALAAFERTLVAADSAFDRFYYGQDERALTVAAQRGLHLFQGRAQCATCHQITPEGATFTDGQFHNAGVGVKHIEAKLSSLATRIAVASDAERDRLIISDPEIAALGRFAVTRNPRDIGQYKTPSLRNVAITGPYMHDGSVATLEDAVEWELYYRSAQSNHPIVLTGAEKSELLAFLRALTSPSWPLGPDATSAKTTPPVAPAASALLPPSGR